MKFFGYTPDQMRKAIVGFITPGIVALGAALTNNAPGEPILTNTELLVIIGAMLSTGGLVFAVKNAPKDPVAPTP